MILRGKYFIVYLYEIVTVTVTLILDELLVIGNTEKE